jgi:hypothetical protein
MEQCFSDYFAQTGIFIEDLLDFTSELDETNISLLSELAPFIPVCINVYILESDNVKIECARQSSIEKVIQQINHSKNNPYSICKGIKVSQVLSAALRFTFLFSLFENPFSISVTNTGQGSELESVTIILKFSEGFSVVASTRSHKFDCESKNIVFNQCIVGRNLREALDTERWADIGVAKTMIHENSLWKPFRIKNKEEALLAKSLGCTNILESETFMPPSGTATTDIKEYLRELRFRSKYKVG